MKDNGLYGRGSLWFGRLRAMTVKELLQLSRDPVILLFMLYLFTFNVYLQGSSVNMQLNRAGVAVRDADKTSASRELISRFRGPYFRLVKEVGSGREGTALLDRGEIMMVLDIPPKFEESIIADRPARVQMQLDATDPIPSLQAYNYGGRITGDFGLEKAFGGHGMSREDFSRLPVIINDQRVWYNPNQNEGWFMSIAEMLEAVTIFSILLPAVAMVREKERGTVEQLLVSPLSPFQVMFSKVAAMTAVILGWTTLCIFAVLKPLFHLPIRGSLALFYLITVIYIFTSSGLGLFISTITRNLAQVGLQSLLLVAPIVMISGLWTPPEAMPPWLRAATFFSPLRHYIDASYGIFLKGVGLGLLWESVVSMAALGGLVFAFGVWRFRRQFR